MKPIAKSHIWRVPAVELYLEDLEQIVSMLDGGTGPPRVLSGKYEFEGGLAELLAARGSQPDHLDLRSPKLGVSLELPQKPESSYLWSDGSPEADGVFLRLKEFLLQRRRWQDRVPSPFVAWMVAVVVSLGLTVVRLSTKATWNSLLTWTPYLIWLISLAARRRTRVVLLRRHESPSFWARKKDDILLLLIGAIVGALGAWIFGK
jgi:hypothetical protein